VLAKIICKVYEIPRIMVMLKKITGIRHFKITERHQIKTVKLGDAALCLNKQEDKHINRIIVTPG